MRQKCLNREGKEMWADLNHWCVTKNVMITQAAIVLELQRYYVCYFFLLSVYLLLRTLTWNDLQCLHVRLPCIPIVRASVIFVGGLEINLPLLKSHKHSLLVDLPLELMTTRNG